MISGGCKDKLLNFNHFGHENNNFKRYEPNELRRKISSCGSRPPAGKVIYLDPKSLKEGISRKPKVTVTVVSQRKPFSNLKNVCESNSSMKMPEQVVIPRKPPLDDVNYCKLDDFKRPKTVVSNSLGLRPAGKEGYGEKSVTTVNAVIQRKPPMNSPNGDSNLEKDAPVNSHTGENNKVKRFEHVELGRKTYLDSRPANKVKYWDPTCSKEVGASTWIEATTTVGSKELARREEIKEAMSLFNEVYERLYQENRLSKPNVEMNAWWRVMLEVVKIVKQRLKWMDPEKVLGPVCGVQVGDIFKFRLQLQMVGLHCQQQSGIDYISIEGKSLAISIVDSHRYSNESGYIDRLIYCGHGGHICLGSKLPPEDQKLEKGNLALKNSMVEKTPVRVIRKVQVGTNQVFLYDGLYIVNRYIQERGDQGKIVLKFELNRLPGQPPTASIRQCQVVI